LAVARRFSAEKVTDRVGRVRALKAERGEGLVGRKNCFRPIRQKEGVLLLTRQELRSKKRKEKRQHPRSQAYPRGQKIANKTKQGRVQQRRSRWQ